MSRDSPSLAIQLTRTKPLMGPFAESAHKALGQGAQDLHPASQPRMLPRQTLDSMSSKVYPHVGIYVQTNNLDMCSHKLYVAVTASQYATGLAQAPRIRALHSPLGSWCNLHTSTRE